MSDDDEPRGGNDETWRAQHDRYHMAQEELSRSIDRLLDELNVDQLMSLRKIFAMERDSAIMNNLDGQVISILRRVHHVDSMTGDPLSDLTMERLDSQQPPG